MPPDKVRDTAMLVMDDDLALLARLVGDVDAFATEHWGRQPLRHTADLDLDVLLDIAEVERLLAAAARRPTFRMVQDGTPLPAERSAGPARLGGARIDDVADLTRITDAVDAGATLVLQSLQRTSLPIAQLCRSLERATSHPVQANAYLTPAGSSGLARHHDDHDVLVVQLHGSKRWKVDGLGELTTERGEVLYLPAGTGHAAEAQDQPSLHLTIGLLRITVGQVVQRALASAEELALDRPLPLGYARPEQAEALTTAVGAVLEDVARHAGAFDPAAVVDAERSRARTRRRPLLLGGLESVLRLHEVGPTTVMARHRDQPARTTGAPDGDDRVVLELADRRVLLPRAMEAAVDHLLREDEVVVGELPGLDEGSRIVLARRLVREGLLLLRST